MAGRALVVRADALHLPMPDESVDLIASSPPYFGLRSYRDGNEHYDGQIGSEPSPQAFLEALWAVMHECWRVLKPSGSCFINLGDKRAGSGGHNNSGLPISAKSTLRGTGHSGGVSFSTGAPNKIKRVERGGSSRPSADGTVSGSPDQNQPPASRKCRHGLWIGEGGLSAEHICRECSQPRATRRNAPDRYNQAAFGRPKSKMLLPHRFAIGCEDGLADPEGKGWVMRQDIVWQKLNGLPESVTDRCRDSHEYLFHFTKEERYFAAVDEVRESYAPATQARYDQGYKVDTKLADAQLTKNTNYRDDYDTNPLRKLPGSVWALPSEPLVTPGWRIVRGGRTVEWCDTWEQATKVAGAMGVRRGRPSIRPEVDHFAAFPSELVRRVVLGWSPSGVCVECGEGRRPVVARTLETTGHTNRRTGGKRDLAEGQGNDRGFNGNGYPIARSDATITGYACRCGVPAPPTNRARVLDVFGGTGTTAGVARALGRHGVSVDLSHDYGRLARWRIERSGHFSKVVNRTNRQNQGSLL